MADLGTSVGAVVIGRNEGERLVRCLNSLHPHGIPIVYVDSASTDDSVANAEGLGATVLTLDMTRAFTAARARAEGFVHLTHRHPALDYVMFVDGDCEVEAGWPDTAKAFMDGNGDYAVVCGRRRERFPEASPYNALADAEWNSTVGEAAVCGGDTVMRVAAYRAVGGFNPAMIAGEEPELCTRLREGGWRIMRLDAPMTIHDAAMTNFGQYWRRAVRSGFGYAQAWTVTRGKAVPSLYQRELLRAALWAGLLPLVTIVAAFVIHPVALAAWPLLTAAQFVRLALRDGAFNATLSVSGKYAELTGALRYATRMLRGQTGGTISYK